MPVAPIIPYRSVLGKGKQLPAEDMCSLFAGEPVASDDRRADQPWPVRCALRQAFAQVAGMQVTRTQSRALGRKQQRWPWAFSLCGDHGRVSKRGSLATRKRTPGSDTRSMHTRRWREGRQESSLFSAVSKVWGLYGAQGARSAQGALLSPSTLPACATCGRLGPTLGDGEALWKHSSSASCATGKTSVGAF